MSFTAIVNGGRAARHLKMDFSEPVRNLTSVSGRQFDVAIIGGGIIGAGIARDAALRGLSVCLVEQRDFGSGTTAGSTRLIHGGLRYLEMLDFGLVRMDLRERETLLRIAPHLVRPLEFLIPFYDRSLFHRAKMHAGMVLYDALSYDKSLPRYRTLGAAEVAQAEPSLKRKGLQGAVSYFDAQVDSPERLAVENIVDAVQHGATAFNYVRCEGALAGDGGLGGINVRDMETGETGEIRARVTVNASGPWFNRVAGRIEKSNASRVRTTKGVHLACGPLTNRAVVLFSPVDGRLFFVMPLMDFGWISTTDTDFEDDPADAAATREDVDYLVRSTAEFVPEAGTTPVLWTNAGVRALVMQEGRESDVSRSHRIDSSPGLVSVLGGKITGYRAIAEEAVDAVCKQLGSGAHCKTAEELLAGAKTESSVDVAGMVKRAVDRELCFHLDDFMLRRTTFGFRADQGERVVSAAAAAMAELLGWSRTVLDAEVGRYTAYLDRTRRFASSGVWR